jgi:N4-gp56 family major capsid protein
MATSTYPAQGGAVGATEATNFTPELWSDEIIASYKKNMVLSQFVRKMNFKGKKGDSLHIPAPSRGLEAKAKAENTAVTLQNLSQSEIVVLLNQHKEVSYLIEDIVETQAIPTLRRHYTDDAGYAMAKDVDDALWALVKSLGDGDGSDYTHSRSFQFNTSTGALEAYDADGTSDIGAFADNGFRRAIQYLDDADVPMDGRVLVVPPSLRNALNGTARYTEQAFVGEIGGQNTIRNGEVGNLYGIPVVVSSNCPTLESGVKGALLAHKDWAVLAEQMSVRSQVQYKQEFLANLFTSDMLYGTKVLRADAGVLLAVGA